MLIVEGPDCVGKTTLCHELLKRLPDHTYAHLSRLPAGFDRYWGYLDRTSRLVVQDRFHFSEIAYAAMRGEEQVLDPETYRLVDAKVRLAGGFTVLIVADLSLVQERYYDGREQMYSADQVLRVASIFRDYGRWFSAYDIDIDFIFHCTQECPYVDDTAIETIADMYQKRQRAAATIASRRPVAL